MVRYQFIFLRKGKEEPEHILATVSENTAKNKNMMFNYFLDLLNFHNVEGIALRARPECGYGIEHIFVKPNESETTEPLEFREGEMLWARIHDDVPEEVAWIPAIFIEGKICSAIGVLSNPKSPSDTRLFSNCPFDGYRIKKRKPKMKEFDFEQVEYQCKVWHKLSDPKNFKILKTLIIVPNKISSEEVENYCKSVVSTMLFDEYHVETVK